MPSPTPRIALQILPPGQSNIAYFYINCGVETDDEGREVLASNWPTLIGGMTIDWGRTDVWAQPDPAVLTITVWQADVDAQANPGRDMAAATPGSGMVGRQIDVRVDKNGTDYMVFQGKTTNVDAVRQTMRTDIGLTPGWLFRIQAADRAGGLAQADKQGFTKLDAGQTMKAAADFLNVFVGNATGTRETYFEAAYQNGKIREVAIGDKSLYDVLVELYGSFSHQFTYQPRRNVLIRIPAAYNHGSYSLGLGRTAAGQTVRLYAPRWVDNTGRQDPQDSLPYASGFISGANVSGDVRISSDMGQSISNLECKWYDAVAAKKDIISRVKVTDQNLGLLKFDSWFSDGLQIDPIMQDVKRKCLAEGASAFHPTLTWDTRTAGDVPDWNTFEALTLPAQTVAMCVVGGSPFAAMMRMPPVFYPAGGVIAYENGFWRFIVQLAPAPLTLSGNPVTFNQLAGSSTGSTVTLDQLDPSISSYDMKFCTSPTVSIWE